MAAPDLDSTKAAAQAILGKGAKIPPPKIDMKKLDGDYENAFKEYTAAIDALQSKIVKMQNLIAAEKNATRQYKAQIADSDFGLDEDDAAAKANIAKAAKLFEVCFNAYITIFDLNDKALDELDKHTMGLRKYKAPDS